MIILHKIITKIDRIAPELVNVLETMTEYEGYDRIANATNSEIKRLCLEYINGMVQCPEQRFNMTKVNKIILEA